MKCSSIFILLISLFCCCKNNQQNVLKRKLPDGMYVKAPFIIKNGDTIISGVAKYYDKNKELIDEFEFKNSKKNGWNYHYERGKKISKIWYVNDSANGVGFYYNQKGEVETETFYYQHKPLMTKFFHSNGHIRLIDFYDNKIAFYAIEYDSAGKKMDEKGAVFAYNFITNQKLDSIKINSQLEIKIPVVSLPEYSTNVEIVKFNTKKDVYDIMYAVPIKNYLAIYQTSFKTLGQQMLGIAGELVDKSGKIIRRDTLYQQIKVIK